MLQDCIFCKIGIGEVKSETLFSDDLCFVINDIQPQAPVHLLIIPHEHFTYLTSMTPDLEPKVGHLFLVAREMAKRKGVENTGYRLIMNQGPHAGQGVAHLHLHLLGGKPLSDLG